MIAFCLANTQHGAMILNRFDYNRSFNDEYYGVGAQLLETGKYDAQEVETLKALLPLRRKYHGDGVIVLDGGANIGVHSVELSKTMKGWGGLIAVEAQERVFYALSGNLVLQNCLNARAVWAALDDNVGYLEIPEPDYTQASSFGSFEMKERIGGENIGQELNYGKPTLRVPTITIDSLNLARLDLLKLDVEGMEMEALAGAGETINRCKPVLYIEVIKIDRDALKEKLEGWGYRVFPNAMNFLAVHESDETAKHIATEVKN